MFCFDLNLNYAIYEVTIIFKVVKNLTSDSYVDYIYNRIKDDRTFDYTYYGNGLSKDDKGTAHISVMTSNGDAVAMTATINY